MIEFSYASEAFKRLNPHLFGVGQMDRPVTEQDPARTLDINRPQRKTGKVRVVVSLVRFGRRELDSDNLSGSFKPLRDAIAATLGIDDGDSRIRWEYSQVETRGQWGTVVRIELI